MITQFMFKEIVYDFCIQNMILSEDMFERALGIVWLPFITILSLIGFFLELFCIPLYLSIGLVYLILKLLERKK